PGTAHPLAGEAQINPRLAGRMRQQPGATHVGDETDARLRHGELAALRHDAVAAVTGQTDAATHDDAVHEGDVGLGIAADIGVEPVLVCPELAREAGALGRAVVYGPHVA